MSLALLTIHELRDALHGAPRDPGPIAEGLRYLTTLDGHTVCAHCAGRIIARGVVGAFQDSVPTFSPCDTVSCSLCSVPVEESTR